MAYFYADAGAMRAQSEGLQRNFRTLRSLGGELRHIAQKLEAASSSMDPQVRALRKLERKLEEQTASLYLLCKSLDQAAELYERNENSCLAGLDRAGSPPGGLSGGWWAAGGSGGLGTARPASVTAEGLEAIVAAFKMR